jgi:hypothetical protein
MFSFRPAVLPIIVPADSPQAVSGRPLDSRSIEVTWKPPPPDKQNGVITGYRLFYVENEDGAGEPDATVVTVGADGRSRVLGALATWTEYKIWVLAFTNVGDGPRSAPIIVQTDEDGRYPYVPPPYYVHVCRCPA